MKTWNAPSVEELNINETANGIGGWFPEGFYGTVFGPRQEQPKPEAEKPEEEKPSTPSDDLS